MQLTRPVQTRFRCASTYRLKLAAYSKSLTHYTKGTPSLHKGAPTACRHPVSGLFHSPRRGAFHLSLTVLVHYRSLRSTEAWRGVPPRSDRISRVPPSSRIMPVVTRPGLSPAGVRLSSRSRLPLHAPWPVPCRLATTCGVSV